MMMWGKSGIHHNTWRAIPPYVHVLHQPMTLAPPHRCMHYVLQQWQTMWFKVVGTKKLYYKETSKTNPSLNKNIRSKQTLLMYTHTYIHTYQSSQDDNREFDGPVQ